MTRCSGSTFANPRGVSRQRCRLRARYIVDSRDYCGVHAPSRRACIDGGEFREGRCSVCERPEREHRRAVL